MSYGCIVMVIERSLQNIKHARHIYYCNADNTIYHSFTAFQCVLEAKPLNIPTSIPASYVRKAEQIVSASYDHSETFSSVSINAHTT